MQMQAPFMKSDLEFSETDSVLLNFLNYGGTHGII